MDPLQKEKNIRLWEFWSKVVKNCDEDIYFHLISSIADYSN